MRRNSDVLHRALNDHTSIRDVASNVSNAQIAVIPRGPRRKDQIEPLRIRTCPRALLEFDDSIIDHDESRNEGVQPEDGQQDAP